LESRVFKLCFPGMRRTITKSTWAEIRTAYASGIGLREIARVLMRLDHSIFTAFNPLR